ncbi:class I SAM-dependent methyltransferase [Permianibacter sp. IMCC34836]|uniref:class I SAM-dependent methyltransferase n=1 Tax=Permianibacter fluminis TaxID=2738515 RepID=UPI001553CE25|nr:class I SAM-dependent methyltransferase [Permianibacter fluminis]NQD38730.1 class I SAM-dependent methyltransferase [Permianibacter fluminis]
MEHWTSYWQHTESLNSFEHGNQACQYSGEIRRYWEAQIWPLADNSTIVDIGTGNGAIAFIAAAAAAARQANIKIFAIDPAEIAPRARVEKNLELGSLLSSIRFFPKTYAESLPFNNRSIDLVTSQFALEYSRLGESIAECSRVLKPSGKIRCITHSLESEIVQNSIVGQRVLSHLIDEIPFFSTAEYLLELIGSAYAVGGVQRLKHDNAANRARRDFNNLMKDLDAKFQTDSERDWLESIVLNVLQLLKLSESFTLSEKLDSLSKIKQANVLCLSRLSEQVSVAMSESRLSELFSICSAHSLEMCEFPFFVDGMLFGHVIEIEKDNR